MSLSHVRLADVLLCCSYPLHPDRSAEEVAGKQSEHWPEPGVIYMDSMAFGMGMCCLQVTCTGVVAGFAVDGVCCLSIHVDY